MPLDEPVFCECYANKAVASMALGNKERIRHRRYMGRDTIIKHFKSLARRRGSLDKYIAIIDKEHGGSVFIDKICERGERININDNRIYMCRSTITGIKIILIIFDPNIEEAFLCRLDKRICNNPRYMRLVKSEKEKNTWKTS